MKASDLLESRSTPVVIIDVQPGHKNGCDYIMPGLMAFLDQHKGPIIAFFNDEEMANDREENVWEYYVDNDLSPRTADRIEFLEKQFGFLRAWMDNGVADSTIIKVIRLMAQHKIDDSRSFEDINLDLQEVLGNEWRDVMEHDPLIIPYYIPLGYLKKLSPFYLCGGGRNECLREVELLCNAFNIKYKRINDFVYG
jgi:hypothetical protein